MTDCKDTFELLGITQEEIQQKVVDAAVERLMTTVYTDEEGDEYPRRSDWTKRVEDAVLEAIDARVDAIAMEHVEPAIGELIDDCVLQRTNEWGDKKGEPLTFTEYLVQRADGWLQAKVDFNGQSKGQGSYGWRPNGTRVEYLIDKHLQYHIKGAMEKALAKANESIAGGIQEAIKVKLAEILNGINVSVKTGR